MPKKGQQERTNTFGLFSDLTFISTDDKYKKAPDTLAGKYKGKQMMTANQRLQEKSFNRIFENEATTDLIRVRRRYRIEENKKILNGPFKPSSAIQKSSGKGGIYGTITKYPAAYLPVIDEPVKEPVKSLPNFIVKTPKKGSAFGNIDMLIGKDYGYESSPFGAKHDLEYNEMLKEKTLRISDKPFVSVRPTKDYFSPFHGLKYDGQVTGPTTKFKGEPITPFKPPSRLGETINPYPVYEAPNPDYKNRMVDFISDEKRRDNLFRPGPGGVAQKSFPIRSIIDANIMIRPNAWIQKEMERR